MTFFTSIELFAAFFREVVVMVHIVDTLPALAVLGYLVQSLFPMGNIMVTSIPNELGPTAEV